MPVYVKTLTLFTFTDATCISTLRPECIQNFKPDDDLLIYIKRVISLFQLLPTYQFLELEGYGRVLNRSVAVIDHYSYLTALFLVLHRNIAWRTLKTQSSEQLSVLSLSPSVMLLSKLLFYRESLRQSNAPDPGDNSYSRCGICERDIFNSNTQMT